MKTLTELEGAILTEIGFRGRNTAFRVRHAFKSSASLDWRGSAGSVYPAIKRLVVRKLIIASPATDGRGTQQLTLSEEGHKELKAWATDIVSSVSIGTDPFRLRAGLWSVLTKDEKLPLVSGLIKRVEEELVYLKQYAIGQDKLEMIQVDLATELQLCRLAWLQRLQKEIVG